MISFQVLWHKLPHPFNLLFMESTTLTSLSVPWTFLPLIYTVSKKFLPSLNSPKLPHPIFLPTLKLGPTIMGPAELPVLFCILRALCFLPDLDASSYSLTWECILFLSGLYAISDSFMNKCLFSPFQWNLHV